MIMDIHFGSKICTTRIDLEALTRDARAENWGTYIVITNRDGQKKKLAVPHALTACRQSCGHRRPAGLARRRNHSDRARRVNSSCSSSRSM